MLSNALVAGDYHVAICIWDSGDIYDLHEPALSFAVEPGPSVLNMAMGRKGFVLVPCAWTVVPTEKPVAIGAAR